MTGVEFGMLGSMTIWHLGREVAVGSAQQRCVLAVLALHAGRVVSLERLIDALWDDDPVPRTARNVVQRCVSDLRKLLAVDPTLRLVHRPPGYVLEVEPERVDLHRFRTLVDQARDANDRVVPLRRALALWQGEPLAGVPGLASAKQALVEERLAVLEDCLAAEVDSGRHAEAVPRLRELVAEHPLRERPTALLMLALYRGGRQADALEHYLRARQRLAEELGTDPSPVLRELHHRILTADPTLTTAEPTVAATRSSVVPRQLPAAPVTFVGRLDELDRLGTAPAGSGESASVVVSAIAGAGGIGKTWLALQWAHRNADRFPDGQLFVDLRGFSPEGDPMAPDVAVRGFLDALGVAPGRIPVDPHAQTALFRSLVAGRRLLLVLVLDNAANTAQVTPLLPGDDSCTVLITSRHHLPGLITGHGARHLPVDVLTDTEARALLATRLGAERVAAEPAAVGDLLALCGGFPLALSIVAGRAHTHPDLPLATLTAELRDTGLGALDNDDPAASLPTVLSWSHTALTGEQARVFALLSIAPGPDICPAAAAGLTGLPLAKARSMLRTLEQASLLDHDSGGRYRMHDLIHHFASDHAHRDLPETERETALRRVVDFYLHTAHAGDRLLDPHRQPIQLDPLAPGCHPLPLSDQATALTWFDTEHLCLLAAQHAAATRGWHQVVWQTAWTLTTFHRLRGHLHDQLAVWQAGLAAADHLDDPGTRALAHRRLGYSYTMAGRHGEALDHLHRALTLAGRTDDRQDQAHTHRILAWAWEQRGDFQRALEHATHALHFHQTLDNPVWEASALNNVGWCAARLGRYDHARTHCEAALALHRRHDDRDGEAHALDSLGYVTHHTGHHHQAIDYYQQALALFRDLGHSYRRADALKAIGHPHLAVGQHEQARAVWREALELYRQQGRDTDAERISRELEALQ